MPRLLLGAAFVLALSLPKDAQASCAQVSGAALSATCVGQSQCQCLTTVDPVCHPRGRILEAFIARGGCDTFGKPLNRIRPRLAFGGTYQTFEWGEIAHYPTFSSGANTPDFVISALQPSDPSQPGYRPPFIYVRWGPTKPYSYDSFLIRWDREDNEDSIEKQHEDDAQQAEAGTGDRGFFRIDATKEGTYAIYVEGCDDGFFGKSCDQGWSFPVYVDRLPRSAQQVPPPATDPSLFQTAGGILDVPDLAKVNYSEEFRILGRLCSGALRDLKDNSEHFEELNGEPALAWLRAADLLAVIPPDPTNPLHPAAPLKGGNCDKTPDALRNAVSEAILASKQNSRPGTNVGGLVRTAVAATLGMSIAALLIFLIFPISVASLAPIALAMGIGIGALVGILLLKSEPGDYDMRLIDYISIYHLYGNKLSASARDHLVDKLLSVRGGEDERDEYLHLSGLPTPVPETENHIWSTEIARYLTNNALYDRDKNDEYNNDKNGMTKWILNGLQQFLKEDFYELNSRPYAAISYNAIQTLANFAAVGAGNCSQHVDPAAPPQSSRCDVRRAARSTLDFLTARFAVSSSELRRAVPFRRKPEFKSYPRLLTNGGDDMSWRLWAYTGGSDFQREERNSLLMEVADGYIQSALLGSYRPPLLITDLMRSAGYPGAMEIQRFPSRARGSRTVEIYHRGADFLISAGGRFDDGKGLVSEWFSSEENAWALPTTLMPLKHGDDFRDFVRIAGHTDPKERSNLCVGPGFACGMNPVVPTGLPDSCQRKVGNWTFIDFTLNTDECPFGYGYYVALYKESCSSEDCKNAAGDPKPGSFGFFEATPWRTFESYVNEVLSLNEPEDFTFDKVNVYRSPTGRHIAFLVDGTDDKWDIVSFGDFGSVTNPERSFDNWPIAQGRLVSSPKPACIFIDNLKLNQRLIIDHTDTMKPRRSVISLAMQKRCGCPLIDACLSPRAE
jgi:hypothetical protein